MRGRGDPLLYDRCLFVQQAVQELRREVCTVWPSDGVHFRIHANRSECGRISERLEDRPSELLTEIDLALGAAAETEPEPVRAANIYVAHMQHYRTFIRNLAERRNGNEKLVAT